MAIPNRDILVLLRDTCRDLDNPQSLERFAQHAGWSKFHLHREFQRVTGETPKQYTQRLRLERAAAALVASDETILAIALAAGFNSHEVFVRAFNKRYGCSPSQYRQRAPTQASAAQRQQHQALVQSISPCIGLFHINDKKPSRSKIMATKDIQRITLDAQPMLFIRRQVEQNQLQPFFAECFGKLFSHGMQNGLAITGNPIARYVSVGPGLWTVDAILPLSKAAEPGEGMEAGELVGGNIVKAAHFGPYENLRDSYVAVQEWMQQEGVEPSGPHWEQYVTDPGEEPDSAKWQTDIYWPIK